MLQGRGTFKSRWGGCRTGLHPLPALAPLVATFASLRPRVFEEKKLMKRPAERAERANASRAQRGCKLVNLLQRPADRRDHVAPSLPVLFDAESLHNLGGAVVEVDENMIVGEFHREAFLLLRLL